MRRTSDGYFGSTKTNVTNKPENNHLLKPSYEYASTQDHEVDYES